MEFSALLTSAGINTAVCVVVFSLYSILRKQPGNVRVYFGRRVARGWGGDADPYWFERFVPSPSWIVKAWETSDDEVLAVAGLDALVFMRIVVFSIRVFAIAAMICIFLVLPVNYYGREMHHKRIHAESLEVFTITNVKEGSRWLWAHCLALYVITSSACVLLYFEYKSISRMRLAHIAGSPSNPSHFTVLVRSIPQSPEQSYSDSVKKFFTKYYASTYLSHQMVYRVGKVQKLMHDAEQMCKMLKTFPIESNCSQSLIRCFHCGGTGHSFKVISGEPESSQKEMTLGDLELTHKEKECPAAFVFFRCRFAAVVAAQVLQSSNPMLWVTELAPEPNDVYWSNLWIPYRQLWLRKIALVLASVVFVFLFLIVVTAVQGLTQLDKLSRTFPFLRGMLRKKFMSQLVTGYLPSVVLILFLYVVPPTMMLFSKLEGPPSRCRRKKSACIKVLYFTIWNIFFVNVFTGSLISQLTVVFNVKDLPTQLARAVPNQVTFFTTYVLTSGWASLSFELIQLFPLICNAFEKLVLRKHVLSDGSLTFPYHTEVPRILVFSLLGFTCSVLAPLILPFLLVYFVLAYLVYRNQILNVYLPKYETGGQYWPIVHNASVFSLVLTQIIALGIFGTKRSPVASGFAIPLIILTLLFNEYCRQRFYPIFKRSAAEVLIDMDQQDDQCAGTEELCERLHSAYCQFPLTSEAVCKADNVVQDKVLESIKDPESLKEGKQCVQLNEAGQSSGCANSETEGQSGK